MGGCGEPRRKQRSLSALRGAEGAFGEQGAPLELQAEVGAALVSSGPAPRDSLRRKGGSRPLRSAEERGRRRASPHLVEGAVGAAHLHGQPRVRVAARREAAHGTLRPGRGAPASARRRRREARPAAADEQGAGAGALPVRRLGVRHREQRNGRAVVASASFFPSGSGRAAPRRRRRLPFTSAAPPPTAQAHARAQTSGGRRACARAPAQGPPRRRDPARALISALPGFSERALALTLTLAPAHKEPSTPGPQRMRKCDRDRPPRLRRKSRYREGMLRMRTRARATPTARVRLGVRFDPSALGASHASACAEAEPSRATAQAHTRPCNYHCTCATRRAFLSISALWGFSPRRVLHGHCACAHALDHRARRSSTTNAHARPGARSDLSVSGLFSARSFTRSHSRA